MYQIMYYTVCNINKIVQINTICFSNFIPSQFLVDNLYPMNTWEKSQIQFPPWQNRLPNESILGSSENLCLASLPKSSPTGAGEGSS